ncbi:hypothetical protein [Lactococcus garvieae]|uniref:DUF2829 domain-containing protein n=1 Tax=Lactococcus garvieae DCC43 TaxID=1231377 RepID=K2NTL9_9LACT|nr:hypothetical protein [Lactococcus garvieae]EKF50923.1 hypothetical protein C426_1695 [Lactococcus garvieae DCC43]
MNIIEATKKALEKNKAITNPDASEVGVVFVPTNSGPLGIVIVGIEPYSVNEEGVYKEKWPSASNFWNPKASDLLRDDWELY